MKPTAQTLRDLPPEKAKELLSKLSVKQAKELKFDWQFWGRPEQMAPEGKTGTYGSLMQVEASVRQGLVLSG